MKRLKTLSFAAILACLASPVVFAEDAGSDWGKLNQERGERYRAGKYDKALVVAKQALEVAENKAGLEHPNVATSLNNLALLYHTA